MRCTCHRRCHWRSFSVLRASRSLALARRSGSFRMTICSLIDFFTASDDSEFERRSTPDFNLDTAYTDAGIVS